MVVCLFFIGVLCDKSWAAGGWKDSRHLKLPGVLASKLSGFSAVFFSLRSLRALRLNLLTAESAPVKSASLIYRYLTGQAEIAELRAGRLEAGRISGI